MWYRGFDKSQEIVGTALCLFGTDMNKNSCAVAFLIKRRFLQNFNINVISLHS